MSSPPVETTSSPPVDTPVETTGPCTRVFWDLMDFRLPYPDPCDTYQNMNSILEKMGFLGELSIMAYVDQDYFPDHLLDEYKSVGITIIHHPQQGDKYASMLVDIILWALENPANYFEPLNLMVISKNINEETDFLKALEALEDRYYNVLLAMPQPLSSSKLHTVSFDWLSTSLLNQCGTFNHKWNHKLKSRDENVGFSYGLASFYPEHYFRGAEVTVFWDVQHCLTGVPKIGPALRGMGYDGKVFIRPYVDGDHQWTWDAENDCRRLHLDLLTRVVTKEAKVTRMLLDLLFWAMNNDDIPANFLLISKLDTNFDRVIKAVEHRGFFHILGYSDEVSLHLKSAPDGEMLINQSVKLQGRKSPEGLEHASSKAVFWLLEEDYPSDPKLAMWRIRSALDKKGYGDIMSITVYVDEGKFPSGWKDVYHKSGMTVVFIDEDYGLSKIDTMHFCSMERSHLPIASRFC